MSSSASSSSLKRLLVGTAIVSVTAVGAAYLWHTLNTSITTTKQQRRAKSPVKSTSSSSISSSSTSSLALSPSSSSSTTLTHPLLTEPYLSLYPSYIHSIISTLRDDVVGAVTMNDEQIKAALETSYEYSLIDDNKEQTTSSSAIQLLTTQIQRITKLLEEQITQPSPPSSSSLSVSPVILSLLTSLLDLHHNRCCHHLDRRSYAEALLDARICVAISGKQWIRALQLAGFADLYLKRPYEASVWYKQAFELEQQQSLSASSISTSSLASLVSTPSSSSSRPSSRISSSFLSLPQRDSGHDDSDDEWNTNEIDASQSYIHVPADIGSSVMQPTPPARIPRHPYKLIPARAMLDALQNQLVLQAMSGPLTAYPSAIADLTEMISRSVADRAELRSLLLKRAVCYMHIKDLSSALRDAVDGNHIYPAASATDPSGHLLVCRLLLQLGKHREAAHELDIAKRAAKHDDPEIAELTQIIQREQ